MIWNEKFNTGIEEIDQQHKQLFIMVEQLMKLYDNKFMVDKYDKILQTIDELKNYTIYHFEQEEQYMKSIGYKKLFSHKVEHMEFSKKLESIKLEDIDENHNASILELINMVTEWLKNHILQTDLMIVNKQK